MSSIIRKLELDEMASFVNISINAYPGIMQNTPDFKERYTASLIDTQENVDTIDFYGLFRNGKLLGGMRIHYYKMNLYSNFIEVGGLGHVAVDLLHKKEKVAKELVEYFIQHFQERGTSFVMLYPFRPDFYKKMGFGYATKMNQYEVSPLSFPKGNKKEGLIYLDESHKSLIRDCYNRYAQKTHGMMLKTDYELNLMFKNPDHRIIGVLENEELTGYMQFFFKKGDSANFLDNDIVMKEWIYQNPNALSMLCTFINNQADQINKVIVNTLDSSLEFLFDDPRNRSNGLIPHVYHETNVSGVGLMYRIINIEAFINQLQGHHFNEECTFNLKVTDTMLKTEPIVQPVIIENGKIKAAHDQEQFDFEVHIDISDLSSLLMGSVDAICLYNYGKLTVSNEKYVPVFLNLFNPSIKPICLSGF